MPLGHGSANPAENGRAAGGPDDPGASVCARGHGFRWPTVCEDYKKDHVSEMSTVGVMQALRRFMALLGRPATIQTDNFRSFQSAASELRRLWRGIDVDQNAVWSTPTIEKGCRGSIHTNLDKNSVKQRAAEELKTIPQIYHEEASSASADLETADLAAKEDSCRT
ncbi:Autophagy-related protein [Trichinella spiralis]|uniref:Autophagy-related protein n=1 Tax=Trichinella spiralis TaxID=6334 RepID=A0ABR3L1L0_TRISP